MPVHDHCSWRGYTKQPKGSPHCPKQTQLLLESPSLWFPGICVFLNKIRVRAKVSLYFWFFSMGGGREEWETSKEAKWRMSWSAMIQHNFIFSLVLTVSIKILKIAANFILQPDLITGCWEQPRPKSHSVSISPCIWHDPLKYPLKMKFLKHYSFHTRYFFPSSFPSKCIQKM